MAPAFYSGHKSWSGSFFHILHTSRSKISSALFSKYPKCEHFLPHSLHYPTTTKPSYHFFSHWFAHLLSNLYACFRFYLSTSPIQNIRHPSRMTISRYKSNPLTSHTKTFRWLPIPLKIKNLEGLTQLGVQQLLYVHFLPLFLLFTQHKQLFQFAKHIPTSVALPHLAHSPIQSGLCSSITLLESPIWIGHIK